MSKSAISRTHHAHISNQQIASSYCRGELQETAATVDEILFA